MGMFFRMLVGRCFWMLLGVFEEYYSPTIELIDSCNSFSFGETLPPSPGISIDIIDILLSTQKIYFFTRLLSSALAE